MMRAAAYERHPSKNRAFVPPCVATFALRRVNESLLQRFENGSDLEKGRRSAGFISRGPGRSPRFLLAAAGLRGRVQIGWRSLGANAAFCCRDSSIIRACWYVNALFLI